MRKREQGILTVEASIVLTLFMLFVLFLFSFERIYRAQNLVSHATIQASDDMALESYLRENANDDKAQDVVFLASRLTGSTTLSEDNFKSLQVSDIPSLAREKFVASISSSEAEADEILKKLGIKDGLSGMDFSASFLDDAKENVIISVSYTLKIQFPIFGGSEVSVTKSSKSKTFGQALNELSVVPNDYMMGSTGGSGSYADGQVVQISASPNYGYKFEKWDDGSTGNPRSVTVNGAKKYIAIFAEDGFGINLNCNPEGAGKLSGENRYKYMSTANVSTSANPGYTFKDWTVFSHRDKTTHTETSQSVSRIIDQSYTFTANYKPNPYNISVESQGYNANVSVTQTDDTSNSGKKITVLFGKKVTLSAPNVTDYIFKGWKKKNTTSYLTTNNSVTIDVPPGNTTYVAVYEIIPYYTIKLNPNGGTLNSSICTQYKVKSGNSSQSMPKPLRCCYIFDGWECNGKIYGEGEKIRNVSSNMVLKAKWHTCTDHVGVGCGVVHDISGTNTVIETHQSGSEEDSYLCTTKGECIICKYCGAFRLKTFKNGNNAGVARWGGIETGVTRNGQFMTEGIYCREHNFSASGVVDDTRVQGEEKRYIHNELGY